jgi:sugar lactone lactonase YvrE
MEMTMTTRFSTGAPQPEILLTDLAFGESPRWHDGRLWVADWGPQEIIAVAADGNRETSVRLQLGSFQAISFDWLHDGRLLVVSSQAAKLLRQEPEGTFVMHADLGAISRGWNEIVVDGRGNAYVNSIGFDMMAGEKFAPGFLALVDANRQVRQVADGLAFPNGMAVTPDNSTLIVAESYAKRLTAFDVGEDGSLSNRRAWAELGDGVPDGICIDTEGAVWYADVPNKRCVRVREGGEVLQTVRLDRGGFACILGGDKGRTLFMVTREWSGVASAADTTPTGQVLTMRAPAPHAGWP